MKKNLNIKTQFAVVGILTTLFAYACSSNSGSTDTPTKKTSSPSQSPNANSVPNCLALTGGTSWQSGISTIFQTNCVGCHAAYSTYTGVSGSISTILSAINSGSMPRGKVLAATDKLAIQTWATAGMPQTDTGVATPSVYPGTTTTATTQNCIGTQSPSPTTYGYATPSPSISPTAGSIPTYSGGIQSIMTTYCLSCHPTYNSLSAVQQNYYSIMSRVNAGTMPKGSVLPSDKKLLLQQWGTAPNTPYGAFAQ